MMQSFTIRNRSGQRGPRAGATAIGLGLLVALGGCSAGADTTNPPPSAARTSPPAAATELEGTYSLTWSQEDLEDVLMEAFGGVDDPAAAKDAQDLATGNSGTIHLVLDAGQYDVIFKVNGDSCPGTYVVDGDRIVMTATTDPSEWDCGDGTGQTAVDARWTLDEGALTLSDWNVPNPESMLGFNSLAWGSKPFQRVNG